MKSLDTILTWVAAVEYLACLVAAIWIWRKERQRDRDWKKYVLGDDQ